VSEIITELFQSITDSSVVIEVDENPFPADTDYSGIITRFTTY